MTIRSRSFFDNEFDELFFRPQIERIKQIDSLLTRMVTNDRELSKIFMKIYGHLWSFVFKTKTTQTTKPDLAL